VLGIGKHYGNRHIKSILIKYLNILIISKQKGLDYKVNNIAYISSLLLPVTEALQTVILRQYSLFLEQ
jgi:hypothetical protein